MIISASLLSFIRFYSEFQIKIAPLEFFNILIFGNKSYSGVYLFAHVSKKSAFYYCSETKLSNINVKIKAHKNWEKL